MSEGRERNKLVVGAFHIDLRQLLRRQALHALHLRNHLITLALNAEPVHVVAAEQRRKILTRLAQINSLGAEFVAVEDNFSLRLVELQIRVGVNKHPTLERALYQLVGKLCQLLWLRGRGDHEVHREVSAAGKGRRGERNHTNTRNFRQWPSRFDQKLLRGLVALAPWLRHHTTKTACWIGDLKDALSLRKRVINVVDLRGEEFRLIQG